MMIHDLLYTFSFLFGLFGVMGLGGAIEFNQGWIASVVLVALSILFGWIGSREEGRYGNHKRRS